jgi:hypothetical protein
MEQWEIEGHIEISDLVARYNANGDTGRFQQVIELFASDAVMDIGDGRVYEGLDEIATIFTSTRDRVAPSSGPAYIRHMTATHQVDLEDESTATGRCYYQVLTHVGLDHWGRYIDRYRRVEGRWLFAHRRVTVDGRSPGSLFAEGEDDA